MVGKLTRIYEYIWEWIEVHYVESESYNQFQQLSRVNLISIFTSYPKSANQYKYKTLSRKIVKIYNIFLVII